MTISVVIPTLNEEHLIGGTVSAVLKQTVPVDQILIVDGGSTDATVSIASAFSGVEVISSAPPVGRQRQAGLDRAVGDLVFFLDADTSPGEEFVSKCISEMHRRGLAIACPWYQPVPSSPGIGLVYFLFNVLFVALQRLLPSGAGSGIIVDRRLALEAGGFRDDLVYEDIEFIRRVARRGRFGALGVRLGVSDRRFRRYGLLRTLGKYLALSFFFTFGLFKQAGVVRYAFADYAEEKPELVVLVDEHNNALGTAPKSSVHGADTPLHRAFSVFLVNRRGQVLLQQRSARKITWPLAWSNSCCGHPAPNESVEDAARRRVREELGIDVPRLRNVLPEYRYRAQSNGVVENEICPVLVGMVSGEPRPDPTEVADVRWVSWDELVSSVGPDSQLTPWCVEEVRLLDASGDFHEILSACLDGQDRS